MACHGVVLVTPDNWTLLISLIAHMTGRLPLASSTRSTGAKRGQGIQKPKDCGRSRRTSPQKRDRSGSTWSQYGPVPAEAESYDDAGVGGHCDPCTPDRAEEPPPPLTFVERMRAGRDAKRDARHAKSAHLHCSSGGSVLDQLAKVESDPKVHSERPVTNRYVKETKRRPIYQARQVARDGNQAETSPDGVAVGSLLINSIERYSDFYLDTCEQRLVAAGASNTTVIRRPADPMLPVRTAACVVLHDQADNGWREDEERCKVWIEHLSTQDLDQGFAASRRRPRGGAAHAASSSGGPWFGEELAMAWDEVSDLAKSFHTRGVRVAKQTSDKFHQDAVTIEFGWSTFAGGSQLQMTAKRHGLAYERKATAVCREKALGRLAEIAAPVAWEFLERRYPETALAMLREVGMYGIYGTGFSKVTIAYDNPTCVHYDSNYGCLPPRAVWRAAAG